MRTKYGMEAGLQANAAVAASQQQAEAEQKARDDVANQMSGPFNALANAAVAKAQTLDANKAAIASLMTTVAELTATNKRLVAQLAEALNNTVRGPNRPPSGIPAPSLAASRRPQHPPPPRCPRPRTSCYHFVTGHHCKTCGRQLVKHVPSDCLELPASAGRMAIVASINIRGKKKNTGE